jgi:hypothetical protein
MGGLLGGSPKTPDMPDPNVAKRQREEEERKRLAKERAETQKKKKDQRLAASAAEAKAQTRKKGYQSTIATDGEGLLEEASTQKRGYHTKFGG